jgi:3-oxoisoapionate kinase
LSKLLLAFYGDDFTGSTDALEQLTLAGLRAALFIEAP